MVHNALDLEPSMGAEDFSFMLQSRPGAYLAPGPGHGRGQQHLAQQPLDFNDDILPLGAALHAGLVERAMPLAGGRKHKMACSAVHQAQQATNLIVTNDLQP